jgi:protein-disulfide isomerase
VSPWVPRVLIVAIGGAVAFVIFSISVGEGGPTTIAYEERGEVQELIAGIRQDGARLGDPDAEVEIELFTDLRSPSAAVFQEDVVDEIIKEYVRDGRVQISIRHFSFARSGVTEAAIAATAAGEQGHQWQFAEVVLRNIENAGPQGIDGAFLKGVAEVTPGLVIDEWDAEFAAELEAQTEDTGYESAIDRDGELAFELKLPAAPAMVITGIGGVEELDDAPSVDEVKAAIERVGVASAP